MEFDVKKNPSGAIKEFLRENLLPILVLLASAFNIWLAYKLTPIATSIELIDQRVYAIEESEPITSREFTEMIRRFDRLESKLDTYILTKK